MASGDTKTESYLRAAAEGTRADLPADSCCNTKTQNLILGVANRIMDVEDEVEEIKNNPDVVDIVNTYADLQAYDTSTLTDKDIIRVLEDSTHNNNSTYYRWNATTNQFDYIGEAGGSGPTVVQTTGNSTTNVMSQNATTSMVYPDRTTRRKVCIGVNASTLSPDSIAIGMNTYTGRSSNDGGIAIGRYAQATGDRSLAIGHGRSQTSGVGDRPYASTTGSIAIGSTAGVQDNKQESIAIGDFAAARSSYSVALGPGAETTRDGEVNVGTTDYYSNWGFNQTKYRVIGGVHDPVDDHDAATKGYVDTAVAGGGGGPTVVQTTGTSQSDVMSQNAVSAMIYYDPSESNPDTRIRIGKSNSSTAFDSVQIGYLASAGGMSAVAIGQNAAATGGGGAVAIGRFSNAKKYYSVALGHYSYSNRANEVNIGFNPNSGLSGFNNDYCRVLGGVSDGQEAHDAVTVEQVNSVIDAINTALSTSIPHIGANS